MPTGAPVRRGSEAPRPPPSAAVAEKAWPFAQRGAAPVASGGNAWSSNVALPRAATADERRRKRTATVVIGLVLVLFLSAGIALYGIFSSPADGRTGFGGASAKVDAVDVRTPPSMPARESAGTRQDARAAAVRSRLDQDDLAGAEKALAALRAAQPDSPDIPVLEAALEARKVEILFPSKAAGTSVPPAGADDRGTTATSSNAQSDARSLLEKGDAALASGDVVAARDFVRAANSIDPGNPAAARLLLRIDEARIKSGEGR